MNLSSTELWSYLIINTPFGYIIFLSWVDINEYKIWILKILIPHVVEPAQPPMNIRKRNKRIGKLPQLSNSWVTYPVPVSIETTLKITALKPTSAILLLWNNK